MNVSTILFLPFSRTAGWKELQQRDVSIPALVWLVVMPLSLLPPIMLYYAGTHYGDDFFPGFADRPWRHIATILFLAELLTFFTMGWLIHTVVNGQEMSISYHDAYLLAALAPLPLWASAVVLAVPSLLLNALAVVMALCISCSLIYHGLQGLCQHPDDEDVAAMATTYTVMAAGGLAWGLLMAIVWMYG